MYTSPVSSSCWKCCAYVEHIDVPPRWLRLLTDETLR